MMKQNRAVVPIISIILMAAVVVILAATMSVLVFDIGDSIQEPGPNIAESSGEFVAGSDDEDQVVRITHVAGDTVDVESIEIVLRVPEQGEQVRLVDLPGDGLFTYTLDDSNIQGNTDLADDTDVIDQGPFASNANTGPIYEDADDQQWSAGETIAIELSSTSGWDFRTSEYTELEVYVVHTESEKVLIRERFST